MQQYKHLMRVTQIALLTLLFTACNTNTKTTQEVQHTTTDEPDQEDMMLPVITLESNATTVNVGEMVQLSVLGTYSDNTSKTVIQGIAYVITPSNSVEVNGTVLTAKKDGNVTLQAKVGNTLSNKVTLNITWVVDGHVLPPEPDPAVNNATLLGVDVNDNGVRDDVERWIYEEYKDKHPIHIDIAMQAGRAYKQVLETPERAKAIHDTVVNAPLFCASYYEFEAQFFNDPILVHERIDAPVKSKYFNTKARSDVYWKYDKALSGDSYPLPKDDEMKSFCDFDTSKYEEYGLVVR